RAVGEPELPARQRGAALHLGQGRRRGGPGAGRAGGAARTAGRPAALGEAVPGRTAAVPARGRLRRAAAPVRPGGQVPQRVPGPVLPGVTAWSSGRRDETLRL